MAFELVEIPESGFVGLILPDPGRRTLRLLFSDGSDLRAMCWVNVGSDGSLYFNPRLKPESKLIHGSGVADGKGGFTELVVHETPIEEVSERNPKISQHSSGVVRRAHQRSRSLNVREITESVLVRQDQYAHPSRFDVVNPSSLRSTDIVVPTAGGAPYELYDSHPLESRVVVAPLRSGEAQVQVFDDLRTDSQTAIVIPATNLLDCQDLTYQIQFFNGPAATWPEVTMSAILDAEQPGRDAQSPGEGE